MSTPDPQVNECVNVSVPSLVSLANVGESLALKAVNVRALQSGAYTSPFKGRGMEFVEARPYQPGDDIRSLDWRVTARTGKPHTKLFQEERERPVLLWVDLRQSMFFATRGAFKSVIAAKAATLLGWSAAKNGDRLGGLIFSEDNHHELKPQNGRTAVLRFIKNLCDSPGWQQSYTPAQAPSTDTTEQALIRLQNVTRPGSLVFMLSDFRGFDNRAEQHMSYIARHNDVVLIHTSDPLEHILPPSGQYRLSDGRQDLYIDTSDKNKREAYLERYKNHEDKLRTLCRRHKMFYLPLGTQDDIANKLKTGLGLKSK